MFVNAERLVIDCVNWFRLGVEALGALIILAGIVVAITGFVRGWVRNDDSRFRLVQVGFARYLALGLEFQLGADILATAVTPSWEQIGKLAAIAVIRTGLNYFLMREMREAGGHGAGATG